MNQAIFSQVKGCDLDLKLERSTCKPNVLRLRTRPGPPKIYNIECRQIMLFPSVATDRVKQSGDVRASTASHSFKSSTLGACRQRGNTLVMAKKPTMGSECTPLDQAT